IRIPFRRRLEVDPVETRLAGALLPVVEDLVQFRRREVTRQVIAPEDREDRLVLYLPIVALREVMLDAVLADARHVLVAVTLRQQRRLLSLLRRRIKIRPMMVGPHDGELHLLAV